jgi:hypothetical protein
VTEISAEGADAFFQPRSDAASAGEVDGDAVGTNAMRALMLGMLLTDAQTALFGLDSELDRVGVGRQTPAVLGWEARLAAADASNAVLSELDAENPERAVQDDRSGRPFLAQRSDLWARVQDSSDPADAIAWLRLVMASGPATVDGVAAASALSHWRRPSKGARVPPFLNDAREILRTASEDANSVEGEIAVAARGSGIGRRRDAANEIRLPNAWKVVHESPDGLSMMVHGTWAWRGDWWYPNGDFHSYAKHAIRPNVYSGGAPYSWSGAYLSKSRRVAARRLARWVQDMSAGHVDTVFAHSYGGAIALESTTSGASYETAVLLSVPVHRNYDIEWRRIGRPVSVRVDFDLVLAAARARQRFPANVDELVLPLHPWRHGATHQPQVWSDHDIANKLSL